MTDLEEVRQRAREEFHREQFRSAVEDEKAHLRAAAGRRWWHRLFPWIITITRRTP